MRMTNASKYAERRGLGWPSAEVAPHGQSSLRCRHPTGRFAPSRRLKVPLIAIIGQNQKRMNTSATQGPGSAAGALRTVLRWVAAHADMSPVAPEWVPGATSRELGALGALGALVGAVVNDDGAHASAFAFGNLREWISRGISPDAAAVDAMRSLLGSSAEQNLAAIYSSIVSGRSRRTLGTFFTPAAEAAWMVRRWEELFPTPRTVVDVGAGVGVFSLRAARAWSEAKILAVDINPVTLGLLALCAQSRNELDDADTAPEGDVVAVEADFTHWLRTEWLQTQGPRLVLGNPPYTRLQLMPAVDRQRLTIAGGGLVGRRAALSAIITAQSLLALEQDDGLALLLPVQWLEADYAHHLRRHLWGQTHRRVELQIFSEQLFVDATVDAVALLVGPVEVDAQPLTISVTGSAQVSAAAQARDPADSTALERLISTARARASADSSAPSNPLSSFAVVRRGVATGANWFFIVDESAIDQHGLTLDLLTPLLRRTRSAPEVLTSDAFAEIPDVDRRWLLTVSKDQVVEGSVLERYLENGRARGVDRGHLCKLRNEWFDLHHDLSVPDIIIGQSSKAGFKLIENRLDAAIANNLYGLRWRVSTSVEQRQNILAWLRSEDGQIVLRAAARVQATGLLKIEPGALAQVSVPESITAPFAGEVAKHLR